MGMADGQLSQLALQLRPGLLRGCAVLRPGLDKEEWSLSAARARADERRAINRGMLIEYRLAGDRKQRAAGSDDAMGLASAKPETVLLVQIADVTHPVPESLSIVNFV